MTGLLSFVVVFGLVVFAHELGHFVAAKLTGVAVQEFGFGYPPRLLRLFRWRETDVTLNLLPLGGFVRMAEDDPTVPGSLARKGRLARAFVLSAGALMNVVLAVVLYSITFMAGTLTPVEGAGAGIYLVGENSPAQQAGLLPGDTMVEIEGVTVRDAEEAKALIQQHLGQKMTLVVRRDGALLPPLTLTPRVNPPPNEGAVGVVIDLPLEVRAYPVWEAVPKGAVAVTNNVVGLVRAVREAIRGAIPFEVSGPIGIYRATVEVARTGWVRLFEFTAFLSTNLFLLNLLPLPALDGGRLVFVLLEWVRGGKRVAPEKEGFVHAVGMMLLIALMVVVTVFDYRRYFG
jgi:regulator of sigma E protease